jgi:two-component sensor histidine kinase
MEGVNKTSLIPYWLMSPDLNEILFSCPRAEEENVDIISICQKEKETTLRHLESEEMFVQEGKPQFIFWKQSDKVIVQMVHEQGDSGKKDLEEERKENRKIKEDLDLHSAKLNAIFDSTALFMWTMDSERRIQSFNKRFREQMAAWFFRNVGRGDHLFTEPIEKNTGSWMTFLDRAKECFKGRKQHLELMVFTDLQEEEWIEVFMDPITHPVSGEVKEISCMAFEVTERRRIREEVARSLKEKETLLKEVHHRVKNNLQLISSIMSLQSSYVSEEGTLDILTECQNRIRSMSYIHDSLYLNKNLNSIDLQHYISGLCRNLIQSYSVDPEKIDLDLQVDEINLSLDQAIPCGLIVNELVSNALKYAFPDGRKGILEVMFKQKENRLALMIADNGTGIGEDIRLEDIQSLGLQLVFTLIEQLDGNVEYSSLRGTKYLITFERLKSRELWP